MNIATSKLSSLFGFEVIYLVKIKIQSDKQQYIIIARVWVLMREVVSLTNPNYYVLYTRSNFNDNNWSYQRRKE